MEGSKKQEKAPPVPTAYHIFEEVEAEIKVEAEEAADAVEGAVGEVKTEVVKLWKQITKSPVTALPGKREAEKQREAIATATGTKPGKYKAVRADAIGDHTLSVEQKAVGSWA